MGGDFLQCTFFEELLEICRSAVLDLLEDAVEGGEALETGTHSDLSDRNIRLEQELFSSLSPSCIDILDI